MNAAPIATQFAQVNGLRLHYASAGQPGRPLIVLLHGFPEFWFAWHHQLGALGHTHFVIAPDTRGVNLSDKPPETYTVEVHEPGGIVVPSTTTLDATCQRWAESVLESLQYGPRNGAALLPGEKSVIHYRIDDCHTEI